MTKQVKVSIIIPVLNREFLIRETLDSILSQTFIDWECIVVDDGSSDGTIDVVNSYIMKDERINLISRPKHRTAGGNAARNFGFEQARGEYIQWFDSDDLMLSDMIEKKVSLIEQGFDCVIGNAKVIGGEEESRPIYSENFYFDLLIQKVRIETSKCLWRKKYIDEDNIFDEKVQRIQDWEFNLRNFKKIENFYFLDEVTYLYRRHGNSITMRNNQTRSFDLIFTYYTAFKQQEESRKSDNKICSYFFQSINREMPVLLERREFKLSVKALAYIFSIIPYTQLNKFNYLVQSIFGIILFGVTGRGYRFFKLPKER